MFTSHLLHHVVHEVGLMNSLSVPTEVQAGVPSMNEMLHSPDQLLPLREVPDSVLLRGQVEADLVSAALCNHEF